jgi:hypothetical protein
MADPAEAPAAGCLRLGGAASPDMSGNKKYGGEVARILHNCCGVVVLVMQHQQFASLKHDDYRSARRSGAAERDLTTGTQRNEIAAGMSRLGSAPEDFRVDIRTLCSASSAGVQD